MSGCVGSSRLPGASPIACYLRGVTLICCLMGGVAACGLRSAVTLTMQPARGTPPDASVIIDEQFVGFLGYVAARGVRLPEGEHRITVEREGYFPWDRIVESDRKPIALDVELIPIPD